MQIEFSRCVIKGRTAQYWALQEIDTPAMAMVSDYPPAWAPRVLAAQGWVEVPERTDLIQAATLHLDVWWKTSSRSKRANFVRLPRWPQADADEFRGLFLFLLPLAPEAALQALEDAQEHQLTALSTSGLLPLLESPDANYRMVGIRAAGRIARRQPT